MAGNLGQHTPGLRVDISEAEHGQRGSTDHFIFDFLDDLSDVGVDNSVNVP